MSASVVEAPPTLPSSSSSSPSPPPSLRDRSTLVKPDRDTSVDPSVSSSAKKEKFLDPFLTSVAPFPAFLQQRLSRMREIDEQCVLRMKELDSLYKAHTEAIHLKFHPSPPPPPPPPSPSSPPPTSPSPASLPVPIDNPMQTLFGFGSAYAIDSAELHLSALSSSLLTLNKSKSSLASELYEVMDGHVRRLDLALKKYEGRLRKGGMEVGAAPVDRRKGGEGGKREGDARELVWEQRREMVMEVERLWGEGGGKRKGKKEGAGGEEVKEGGSAEPVYCLCKKVSYGSMVGCDNEECEIEWFHFACVGLESKPRGKWLCPNCRDGKKKKTKR